jgi:hypothetical protein
MPYLSHRARLCDNPELLSLNFDDLNQGRADETTVQCSDTEPRKMMDISDPGGHKNSLAESRDLLSESIRITRYWQVAWQTWSIVASHCSQRCR